jgi:hypothetical protein
LNFFFNSFSPLIDKVNISNGKQNETTFNVTPTTKSNTNEKGTALSGLTGLTASEKHPDLIYDSTNILMNSNPLSKKTKCNCKKSHCRKLYCECYANKEFCVNCNCEDCHNMFSFKKKITQEEVPNITTCTCTKSNCKKKYCECFKEGKKCNSKCRCVACENKRRRKKNIFKNVRITKEIPGSRNFQIDSISICIINNKIDINKIVII